MAERLANRAATYLADDIDDDDLTMSVTGASDFPDSGDFRIRIDDELLLVTAVDSLNFTITRGIEGTTAASHSAPAKVIHVLTVGGLNQYMLENVVENGANSAGSDTYSGKGVYTTIGKMFLPTDDPVLLRANGSTWEIWDSLHKISRPAASDYTIYNPSSSETGFTTTVTDFKSGQYLQASRNDQGVSHLHTMTIDFTFSTPVNCIAAILPVFGADMTGEEFGISLTDSTADQTISLGIQLINGIPNIILNAWNHIESEATSIITTPISCPIANIQPIYLRISIDSSNNWTFGYSNDGLYWVNFAVKTSLLTAPDLLGIYHNSETTAVSGSLTCKPGFAKILKFGTSTDSTYN